MIHLVTRLADLSRLKSAKEFQKRFRKELKRKPFVGLNKVEASLRMIHAHYSHNSIRRVLF